MEALKYWADLAQSLSLIFAALFAIYGFDAWRREFVGKRRIELAEEVLALFYQAKDILEEVRSPFGFGGEGKTRKAEPKETPEQKEALDRAYVLIERYNKHSETFSRLHSLRYRFIAQFGKEPATPFDELNKVINELIAAAYQMARYSNVSYDTFRTEEAREKHHQRLIELDLIYYGGTDEDPISPRVLKLIEDMEKTCKNVIESRGTLFSYINSRFGFK